MLARTSRTLWRRYVQGSPLERPARHVIDVVRRTPPGVRKNQREDWALCDLIKALPDDANCIDVGANEGNILQAMMRGCPRGRHIAFEPVPELREALRRRFPTVDVRPEALGDSPGEAVFTLVPGRASLSGLASTLDLAVPQQTVDMTVPVVRLDDILPAGYVPSLLKIDVEGAEMNVLVGARRTLRTHRPLVAFEHQYGSRSDAQKTLSLYDELAAAGYSVETMDGAPLSSRDFCERVATRTDWNFLARPRSAQA